MVPTTQDPISFGFKESWRNKQFWLPLTAIFIAAYTAASIPLNFVTTSATDPSEVSLNTTDLLIAVPIYALLTIVAAGFSIVFATRALFQVRHPDHAPSFKEWNHDVPWKRAILALALSAAIMLVLYAVLAGVAAGIVALNASPVVLYATVACFFIAFILISPFFTFVLYSAIDGARPTDALRKSFSLARSNYLKTLIFILLVSLIVIAAAMVSILASVPFFILHPVIGVVAAAIVTIVAMTLVTAATYLATTKLYTNLADAGLPTHVA